MIGPQHIFDIPVYRCDVHKHSKEMGMEKRELMKSLENSGVTRQEAPTAYSNAENYFDNNLWYSWKYNEIIGWIQIIASNRQIRGEYWWISSKRIIRRGKKEFHYCGKAFESEDIISENSMDIFTILCRHLNQLSKERPFKGRYIDTELLLNLGSYINWRTILDSVNFPPNNKI